MNKFIPESLNGTHKLVIDDREHRLGVQWYPGVGAYYAILDDDPAQQFTQSIKQLKKLLLNLEVKTP